jgi:hypothetical protein
VILQAVERLGAATTATVAATAVAALLRPKVLLVEGFAVVSLNGLASQTRSYATSHHFRDWHVYLLGLAKGAAANVQPVSQFVFFFAAHCPNPSLQFYTLP